MLLYDPCNIRYAFDCTNMQSWTLHNPMRYALVLAGGPANMFELTGCLHQSEPDLRVAGSREPDRRDLGQHDLDRWENLCRSFYRDLQLDHTS